MEDSGGVVEQSGGENGDHAGRDRDPAPVIPATASARLRAAREAQGLTIADIARRTRITLRHVEALDRGDLSSLPGRPYVIGFVRSYARAVGLDGEALVALVRREMEFAEPAAAPRTVHQFDVDDPAKTPSRLVTWLALALFVCILGVGAVFWRHYLVPDAGLPALVSSDPTPAPVPAAAPPPPAAPAPSPTGPVAFTAREPGIWVKFYDGHGQQLIQKELAQGETYTVPADAFEPRLWTGRPDALTITIGGQPVPPLSDHRGVMRDVPVTAQALLARAAAVPAPAPTLAAPTLAAPVDAAVPPPVVHHRVRRADPDAAPAPDAAPTPAASVAPAPVASPSP